MTRYRPVLTVPRSAQTTLLSGIAIAGLVAIWVVFIYAWSVLPDIIPIHFGLDGQPNGWGSKATLWLFPILSLFLYGSLTLLTRYPHTFNYPVRITEENAARQYQIACAMLDWMKVEMVWLFAYIEWQILRFATVGSAALDMWFLLVVIGVIFVTNGFWLRQAFLAR